MIDRMVAVHRMCSSQYRMFGLNTITIYLVQVEVQVAKPDLKVKRMRGRESAPRARLATSTNEDDIAVIGWPRLGRDTRALVLAPRASRRARRAAAGSRAAPDTARTARCDVTCKTASD